MYRDRELARARLLARSADLLLGGLDQQAVCRTLVELVVPELCQEAVVELVGEVGAAGAVARGEVVVAGGPAGVRLPLQPGPADGTMAAGATVGRCVVPLKAGGRRLGSLTALRWTGQPYTQDERELLRAVADRAALVLDAAVLWAEQRETSLALQQALLTEPAVSDDLVVVVRYHPGLDP